MAVVDVYVFREACFARGGEAAVCAVKREQADALLGIGWAKKLFGGSALYRNPEEIDFTGIWGNRNASRLRRFLRECGAELKIHHSRPDGVRLRGYSTTKGSRPRVRLLSNLAA